MGTCGTPETTTTSSAQLRATDRQRNRRCGRSGHSLAHGCAAVRTPAPATHCRTPSAPENKAAVRSTAAHAERALDHEPSCVNLHAMVRLSRVSRALCRCVSAYSDRGTTVLVWLLGTITRHSTRQLQTAEPFNANPAAPPCSASAPRVRTQRTRRHQRQAEPLLAIDCDSRRLARLSDSPAGVV